MGFKLSCDIVYIIILLLLYKHICDVSVIFLTRVFLVILINLHVILLEAKL